MQSHYIYALLSNNVYDDPKNNLPVDWEEFKFDSSSLVPSDDFYAVSYINEPLKKLIIAFRGTTTIENFVREDLLEIAFNNIPHLFVSHAVPFVNAVRTQAIQQYPNFEISFTGHSLGAILAELCAAKYTRLAVTFESPGSWNMINELAGKDQLPRNALTIARDSIISYQGAISTINRYNAYVGTRIRLYPDLPFTSFQPPSPPIDGCGSLDMPTPGIFVQYSWQQHHMAALLAQFDPEEGPLVYSVYAPLSSGLKVDGSLYSFNTWLNYDENPYYWDKTIETIYFPVCGHGQTLQAYKENYIKKALHRNTDPYQQIGITINAPGNSHYPALTIWGTTSGKDTLLFGKGKFKVIAYGFNTYKVARDAQVSCDIEQMTLDSNRESRLFVGDQLMQGYAFSYSGLPFLQTLYLSNGLKASWSRVPEDISDTHVITMGGSASSHSDFTPNFPVLRFANSPSGQFNILAGKAYGLVSNRGVMAVSSDGSIYDLDDEPANCETMSFTQKKLTGEVISTVQFSPPCRTDPACLFGIFQPISIMRAYERAGQLNLFYSYQCDGEFLPAVIGVNAYSNVLVKNEEIVLSCALSDSFNFKLNNFDPTYSCCDPEESCSDGDLYLFSPMEYPVISGYSILLTNIHLPQNTPAAILDQSKSHLFDLGSPLSNGYHIYLAGRVLANSDSILIGTHESPYPPFSYSLYLETSNLAYFSTALTVPISAFLLLEPGATPKTALTTAASAAGLLEVSGKMWVCMQGAAAQGIISAMSEVAAQAGYCGSMVQKASQTFYYSSVFCVQFYLHYYQNKTAAPFASPWEEAAYSAARDITVLLAVNIALTGIKNLLQWAGKKCERRQWSQTGKILKRIGDVVQYASYGYHFYRDSLAETAAAIATGAAVQKATQPVCQRATTSFLKRHQQSLSLRQGSNDMESQQFLHQPLLNAEEEQQGYHTFSEATAFTPRLTSTSFTKTLPDKKRQPSAFVALSIYNKTKFNQATIPVGKTSSSQPQKKKYCTIM